MKYYFQDKKADMIINTYVDDVLVRVMKRLSLEIPDYEKENDPTKNCTLCIDWTINKAYVQEIKCLYSLYRKQLRKRKIDGSCKVDKKKICTDVPIKRDEQNITDADVSVI